MKTSQTITGYYSDLFFLVFIPVLSVLFAISMTRILSPEWVVFLTMAITNAHLVIVFFRSHGNEKIFKAFPIRFTWIPLFLLLTCVVSNWVFILLSFLAVWWDSWHSSLQTFGIARIYDLRNGQTSERGRTLDFVLNLVIYVGPVLSGATLLDQLNNSFFQAKRFMPSFLQFFTKASNVFAGNLFYFKLFIVFISLFLFTLCIFEYLRLLKSGYKMHPFKLYLIIATGVSTVFSWGFNSFGEAFLAMNMFHAVQYFAMIWWSEGNHLKKIIPLVPKNYKSIAGFLLLLAVGGGYGFFVSSVQADWIIRVVVVVAILHFWFDSFIWSVRSKQIV